MFPEPDTGTDQLKICVRCQSRDSVAWDPYHGVYLCNDSNACWERFVEKHRVNIPQVIQGVNDHE